MTRCYKCGRRHPMSIAEYELYAKEPYKKTCWTGWGTMDARCGDLEKQRLKVKLGRVAFVTQSWLDEANAPPLQEMSNALLLKTCASEVKQVMRVMGDR